MSTQEQNSSFATQMIATLVELGITHFAICPGSRSTLLTIAIARNPHAESYIFHDERSAAFFVLGLGKTGQLSAMITTSGTAVANALPAVMEASNTHVPMLLISADRPPELRGSGANQTMDQVKLFGKAVRFFFDFPCPSPDFSAKAFASTLSYGVSKCFGSDAGPVHFNCMFREPLEPIEQFTAIFPKPSVYSHPKQELSIEAQEQLLVYAQEATNPILIIGALESKADQCAALRLAKTLNWPVFVDISSGIALQNIQNKIPFVDVILEQNHVIPTPDLILQLGRGFTTKRYEHWTRTLNVSHIIIDSRSSRHDPGHSCTWRLQVDISSLLFLEQLQCPNLSWIRKLQIQLQRISIPMQEISEISIAHQLPSWLPNNSQLFIGNSMPIRDCNNYSLPAEKIVLACNRGVSGIDGIISTAAGWAIGGQKHSFLLIGDISFMHDIGVLFSLQAINVSLTIVLINNSGGGIFSFLPVSKEEDVFETHFATKHSFELAPVVQAMGIKVQSLESMTELKTALEQPIQGLSFLEIRTDREQNYREHQDIKRCIITQLKALDI